MLAFPIKKRYHTLGDVMKKVVEMAHDLLWSAQECDGVYADFTCGNGFDTCFLAGFDQVKRVYAFDIQEEALMETKHKLILAKLRDRCELILDGHEHMEEYIKEPLTAGIFNFGYLPHGDPGITTKLSTSRVAVEKALKLLKKHGILILVIYPGHEAGKLESRYFSNWIKELDSHVFSAMSIRMENKQDAPYLLVVEKQREKGDYNGNKSSAV